MTALRRDFALPAPRIAVLGLNPHAGEAGVLGDEEIETIEPVLAALRAEGMTLIGPLPADTAFLPQKLAGFDAVLAMYHDQGLPVLKHAGFEQAVNITLGLPYPRVAVDHGTALEIAGKGTADPVEPDRRRRAVRATGAGAEARMSHFKDPPKKQSRPALPARPQRHREDRARGQPEAGRPTWSRSGRARARSPFRCCASTAR